jgi:sugar-specific transcriptional regulator TrmB
MQDIVKKAMEKSEFLGVVSSDVEKWMLLGAEGTWLLHNESAIHNYLKSMILRTKANIFIVVPDIKLVPIDVIKKLKKTSKVTIACGPSPDRKIAEELLNSSSSLKIKTISVLDHKIYGAQRDNEEAFYGPYVEKGDDMVVTVSVQEEMIAIITEGLSPYWLGRSTAFQLEEK